MSEAQQLITQIQSTLATLTADIKAQRERHDSLVKRFGLEGDAEFAFNVKTAAGAIADSEVKLQKLAALSAAEPDTETIVDELLTKGVSRGKKSELPYFEKPRDEAQFLAMATKDYRRAFDHFLRKGGNGNSGIIPGTEVHSLLTFKDLPKAIARYVPDEVKSALSVDFEQGAGFFAPPQMEAEIDRAVLEYSPVSLYARTASVGRGSYEYLQRTDNRETVQRGVGERQEPTQVTQQIRFNKRRIDVYETTIFPALTNTAIEDSDRDLVADLQADAQEDFVVDEGRQFVNGTGDGEAEGFMVASSVLKVASGSAATFNLTNLRQLPYELKDQFMRNGRFFLSRGALSHLVSLRADSGAGAGTGEYLWSASTEAGTPSLISGYPWVMLVDMDDVAANAFPVIFGDMYRGYRIARRRGVRVIRDEITSPSNVIFRMTKRFGGHVSRGESLVKLKCATSL